MRVIARAVRPIVSCVPIKIISDLKGCSRRNETARRCHDWDSGTFRASKMLRWLYSGPSSRSTHRDRDRLITTSRSCGRCCLGLGAQKPLRLLSGGCGWFQYTPVDKPSGSSKFEWVCRPCTSLISSPDVSQYLIGGSFSVTILAVFSFRQA